MKDLDRIRFWDVVVSIINIMLMLVIAISILVV